MISLLITLIIVGAGLYLIGLLPIDGTIKQIIYMVAIVFVLIWLLRNLGAVGLG
jgi:hypothetical protein